MPDLITLAIPAFVGLLFAEAIAAAIMQRDIYEPARILAIKRTFGGLHESR